MADSPGLTASIQEMVEAQRETQWRRDGVPESLILMSRQTGMDAADMGVFQSASGNGYLIVVRCPKPEARAWHGVFGPKTGATYAPTGSAGLLVTDSRIMVSDYDLMSVWRIAGAGWDKLFIAPAGGAKRGPLAPAAQSFIVGLNAKLISRIQHGCQDDFYSPINRGVRGDDTFATFSAGRTACLRGPQACAAFYRANGLEWPYDGAGRFTGG